MSKECRNFDFDFIAFKISYVGFLLKLDNRGYGLPKVTNKKIT